MDVLITYDAYDEEKALRDALKAKGFTDLCIMPDRTCNLPESTLIMVNSDIDTVINTFRTTVSEQNIAVRANITVGKLAVALFSEIRCYC